MVKTPRQRYWLGAVLAIGVPLFLIGSAGGDYTGWMYNGVCYQYLGCNSGFFGWDALMHFVSGGLFIVFILYLIRVHPHFEILNNRLCNNLLILAALSCILGVSWEILEFIFDHVRMDILHQNIVMPNMLAQANNVDTMGDLVFNLLGASAAIFIGKVIDRELF